MIIALETYDETTIKKICKNDDIMGVVMGDPHCNKRMFVRAEEDMRAMMLLLKQYNKVIL